jgi:hypothetical protein
MFMVGSELKCNLNRSSGATYCVFVYGRFPGPKSHLIFSSQFFGYRAGFEQSDPALCDSWRAGCADVSVANSTQTVHNPTTSLKTAALLAFIGMLLLTVLMAADFINTVTGIMHDVVPAVALLRSLIYLLASLTVTVFFGFFKDRNLESIRQRISRRVLSATKQERGNLRARAFRHLECPLTQAATAFRK